jgi:hypothetical protein
MIVSLEDDSVEDVGDIMELVRGEFMPLRGALRGSLGHLSLNPTFSQELGRLVTSREVGKDVPVPPSPVHSPVPPAAAATPAATGHVNLELPSSSSPQPASAGDLAATPSPSKRHGRGAKQRLSAEIPEVRVASVLATSSSAEALQGLQGPPVGPTGSSGSGAPGSPSPGSPGLTVVAAGRRRREASMARMASLAKLSAEIGVAADTLAVIINDLGVGGVDSVESFAEALARDGPGSFADRDGPERVEAAQKAVTSQLAVVEGLAKQKSPPASLASRITATRALNLRIAELAAESPAAVPASVAESSKRHTARLLGALPRGTPLRDEDGLPFQLDRISLTVRAVEAIAELTAAYTFTNDDSVWVDATFEVTPPAGAALYAASLIVNSVETKECRVAPIPLDQPLPRSARPAGAVVLFSLPDAPPKSELTVVLSYALSPRGPAEPGQWWSADLSPFLPTDLWLGSEDRSTFPLEVAAHVSLIGAGGDEELPGAPRLVVTATTAPGLLQHQTSPATFVEKCWPARAPQQLLGLAIAGSVPAPARVGAWVQPSALCPGERDVAVVVAPLLGSAPYSSAGGSWSLKSEWVFVVPEDADPLWRADIMDTVALALHSLERGSLFNIIAYSASRVARILYDGSSLALNEDSLAEASKFLVKLASLPPPAAAAASQVSIAPALERLQALPTFEIAPRQVLCLVEPALLGELAAGPSLPGTHLHAMALGPTLLLPSFSFPWGVARVAATPQALYPEALSVVLEHSHPSACSVTAKWGDVMVSQNPVTGVVAHPTSPAVIVGTFAPGVAAPEEVGVSFTDALGNAVSMTVPVVQLPACDQPQQQPPPPELVPAALSPSLSRLSARWRMWRLAADQHLPAAELISASQRYRLPCHLTHLTTDGMRQVIEPPTDTATAAAQPSQQYQHQHHHQQQQQAAGGHPSPPSTASARSRKMSMRVMPWESRDAALRERDRPLVELAKLQRADGSWELSPSLSAFLSLKTEDLVQAMPREVGQPTVWATAFCAAFLKLKTAPGLVSRWQDGLDLCYRAVVAKAEAWIDAAVGPGTSTFRLLQLAEDRIKKGVKAAGKKTKQDPDSPTLPPRPRSASICNADITSILTHRRQSVVATPPPAPSTPTTPAPAAAAASGEDDLPATENPVAAAAAAAPPTLVISPLRPGFSEDRDRSLSLPSNPSGSPLANQDD